MKKYLIAILMGFVFTGAGCVEVAVTDTGSAPSVVTDAKFGEEIKFAFVTQEVTLEDGVTLTLKEVRDSRCPKDVQCIWAGELNYDFVFSDGQTATLGTTTKTSTTAGPYTITFVSITGATSSMPTVIVTRSGL